MVRSMSRYALLVIAGCCVLVAGLLAIVLSHPYPSGANCTEPTGYREISHNADIRISASVGALIRSILGAAACVVGGVRNRAKLGRYAAGTLLFGALALVSLVLLIGSSLYCQN